jgi:hypothetical protein
MTAEGMSHQRAHQPMESPDFKSGEAGFRTRENAPDLNLGL